MTQLDIDFFNTIQATHEEAVKHSSDHKKGVDEILALMSDGIERTWFQVKSALPHLNECSIKRTLTTRTIKIEDKLKMIKGPSGKFCHKYKLSTSE